MRLIHRVSAVLAVCTLVNAAAAFGPCCGGQSPFSGRGLDGGYSAPAYGGQTSGLVPGCCEFPPSCCANVWDGYCNEQHGCRRGFRGSFSRPSGHCRPQIRAGGRWGGAACGCFDPGTQFSEAVEEPTPVAAPSPPDEV